MSRNLFVSFGKMVHLRTSRSFLERTEIASLSVLRLSISFFYYFFYSLQDIKLAAKNERNLDDLKVDSNFSIIYLRFLWQARSDEIRSVNGGNFSSYTWLSRSSINLNISRAKRVADVRMTRRKLNQSLCRMILLWTLEVMRRKLIHKLCNN